MAVEQVTATASGGADCSQLLEVLPGKVFFPASPQYNESSTSYFSAFENKVKPTCIVRPADASDVSAILKAIAPNGCVGDLKAAVRGGGHQLWAGAANIEEGVTIDMRNISAVTLDKKSGIASIGAGTRWGNVYSTLLSEGMAVSGGRVAKVGVGGLITGGGMSFFSQSRGMVCDDVINYEVVLASGKVVNANATEHPDLFRALKGGTNNFGIVTRFDMPSFPQLGMWGGFIFYNQSAVPDLLQRFVDFANAGDAKSHLILAVSLRNGTEYGASQVYYDEPVPRPASLQPFSDLQPQLRNSLRNDTMYGFAEEQSTYARDNQRQWYFAFSFRADFELMNDVRKLRFERFQDVAGLEGFFSALVLQPISKNHIRASNAKGNSLGFREEDGPFVIASITTEHKNPADDDQVRETVLSFIDEVDELAKARGLNSRYLFLNYAYKTQKPLQGYGPENMAQLKATAAKYDPHGFFQYGVPGGFKLRDV